jgi:hypothetical protein
MAISHNLNIKDAEYVASKLNIIYYDGAVSQQVSRDDITELPHVTGEDPHATLAGIVRDGENLWPVSGEVTCTYTWSEDNHDDIVSSLSSWKTLLSRSDVTVTTDAANRTASVVVDADYDHSDWIGHPVPWVPKATSAVAAVSQAAKFVCIEKTVDIDDWTIEYLTVDAGSSKLISKQGTTCYLFVSHDATLGSTNVNAGDTVLLSSSNINVIATSRTTIIRMYK